MTSCLLQILQLPFVADIAHAVITVFETVWLGPSMKNADSSPIPYWYTGELSTSYMIRRMPDYHPLSLKYLWIIVSAPFLDYSALMFSMWSPFSPTHTAYDNRDLVIMYGFRNLVWLYRARCEPDWRAARDSLEIWDREHPDYNDDATWNIIGIFEDPELKKDITIDMFPFMSPTGDFVSMDHLERISDTPVYMEYMSGAIVCLDGNPDDE